VGGGCSGTSDESIHERAENGRACIDHMYLRSRVPRLAGSHSTISWRKRSMPFVYYQPIRTEEDGVLVGQLELQRSAIQPQIEAIAVHL
jgi:hypothetical protein